MTNEYKIVKESYKMIKETADNIQTIDDYVGFVHQWRAAHQNALTNHVKMKKTLRDEKDESKRASIQSWFSVSKGVMTDMYNLRRKLKDDLHAGLFPEVENV